jgi:hypothetical protein
MDRDDGSVRFEVRTTEPNHEEDPRTHLPRRRSATCQGRLWALLDTSLASVNTTTASVEWASYPGPGRRPTAFTPTIAGDAVIAVIQDLDRLRYVVPAPLGGVPDADLDVDARTVALSENWGTFDASARVLVSGSVLYLLRNSRPSQGITTMVLTPDWRALPTPPTGKPPSAGGLLVTGAHSRMLLGRGESPYLLDAAATPEGVLVTGAWTEREAGGEPELRACLWVSSTYDDLGDVDPNEPSDEESTIPWRFDPEEVAEPLRDGPVRVGMRLLFPVDRGLRAADIRLVER